MQIIKRVSEESSWQQVQELANNKALHVGDQITDIIRGIPMTFEVAEVTDEEIMVISKYLWPERVQWNREWTTEGGFRKSNVCRFLNKEIYNMLPEELQEVINERKYKEDDEEYSLKLWFPSEREVFGDDAWLSDDEAGQQLSYFKDPGNRVKCDAITGSRAYWWLSSAYSGNSTYACIVDDNGVANYIATSYDLRVPICFCIAKQS